MTARGWLVSGAGLGAAAIAAGAFGAHALKGRIAPPLVDVFETAARYHLVHAVVLLVVGLLAADRPRSTALQVAGWSLASGVVVFSGSLYAMALSGQRWLGALTPVGGLALIAGWLALAAAAVARSEDEA